MEQLLKQIKDRLDKNNAFCFYSGSSIENDELVIGQNIHFPIYDGFSLPPRCPNLRLHISKKDNELHIHDNGDIFKYFLLFFKLDEKRLDYLISKYGLKRNGLTIYIDTDLDHITSSFVRFWKIIYGYYLEEGIGEPFEVEFDDIEGMGKHYFNTEILFHIDINLLDENKEKQVIADLSNEEKDNLCFVHNGLTINYYINFEGEYRWHDFIATYDDGREEILPIYSTKVDNYSKKHETIYFNIRLMGLKKLHFVDRPIMDVKVPTILESYSFYQCYSERIDRDWIHYFDNEHVHCYIYRKSIKATIERFLSNDTKVVSRSDGNGFYFDIVDHDVRIEADYKFNSRKVYVKYEPHDVFKYSDEEHEYSYKDLVLQDIYGFEKGYKIKEILFLDEDGNDISMKIDNLSKVGSGFIKGDLREEYMYSFNMPDQDVYIHLKYVIDETTMKLRFDFSDLEDISVSYSNGYLGTSTVYDKVIRLFKGNNYDEDIYDGKEVTFDKQADLTFRIVLEKEVNGVELIAKGNEKTHRYVCTSPLVGMAFKEEKKVTVYAYIFEINGDLDEDALIIFKKL